MLWRGKKSLRLATTGTLRSQLLPKTSRAHLPPTSLSSSPCPPALFLTPLSFLHQVRSTQETHLDPPHLHSFHTLSLPPTSSTTPTQFGTTCKHGDRREGDRSVTSPSPPARLPVFIPLVQLQISRHLTTLNLAAPELCHGAMGHTPALCLETRELAPATPDRLPSSIVAASVLNGFESTSRPFGPCTDCTLQITLSTTRIP